MNKSLQRPQTLVILLVGLLAAAGSGGCGPDDAPAATIGGQATELATSRCQRTADSVDCTKRELYLNAILVPRKVTYEVPLGTPPAGGWPVAIFFQGSFFAGDLSFAGRVGDPFGRYHLALTVKSLLDAGYAVLAPNALVAGATFWQTNVPPWSALWTTSSDHAFMLAIIQAIKDGKFGALDASRLFATGISSGGFMTSRMAVSYRGMFRALAVHSASYATCSALCLVPALPVDHPPTLFLHGKLDLIVTVPVMEQYRDALQSVGHEVRTVINPTAGHEWLPEGETELVRWFDAHL